MFSQILDEARSIVSAWGETDWLDDCQLVYSRRLRRSLGVTYPARRLIRLHPLLTTNPALRAQVLCHELAHLQVYRQQGSVEPPHGPAWRALVRQAGGNPAAKLFVPGLRAADSPRPATTYRHLCPVCQQTRTAKRRMTRWRCPRCIAQGLSGELVIEALR